MKTPTELKREAEIRKALVQKTKEDIKALINKIPQSHFKWGYQETVQYKKTVDQARQVLNNPAVTPPDAHRALQALKAFHKPNYSTKD